MVGLGRIHGQFGGGVNRAEEEPGAVLARDQDGVLALPAEARRLRQRLFHHRGGVDEDLDVGPALGGEQPGDALELALDDVVIVAPARIERNRRLVGWPSTASGSPSGA